MEPRAPTMDCWWATLADEGVALQTTSTFRPEDLLDDVELAPGGFPVAAGDPLPSKPGLSDLALRSVLGEGGMGVVHLAVQSSLDREVAVKQTRSSDARAARALLREARIMGRLEHPNVVPVHALDHDEAGRLALVMKRVQGVSWRTLLDEPDHPVWKRRLPLSGDHLARQVHILLDVCNALGFAHARGVIHRDLKPDNVMVGEFGEVYLMDWGIAAEIGERTPEGRGLIGTPAYMPPELLERPCVATTATDIYLLGACLHEILTGEPRHHGDDLRSVLQQVASSPPHIYGADIPAPLARLCNQACAADPAQRPPSADAFRESLVRWLRRASSERLMETARARVSQLEQLTRAAEPDPVEVRGIFQASRSALLELGQEREGDPEVGALLRHTLTLGARFDLAHGDLVGASTLIDELEELGGEAEDLRQNLDRYRRQADQLRRLSRELDYSVSQGPRTLMITGATLLVLVLVGVSVTRRIMGAEDHIIIGYPLAVCVVLGLMTPLVWPWMRRNRVNRQAAGSLAIMSLGWLALRSLMVLGGATTDNILVADLAVVSSWVALLGLFFRPWLAAPVPVILLGAALTAVAEDRHGVYLLTIVASVMVWTAAWIVASRRAARPRARDRAPRSG